MAPKLVKIKPSNASTSKGAAEGLPQWVQWGIVDWWRAPREDVRVKIFTRWAWARIGILTAGAGVLILWYAREAVSMPGESYKGSLPVPSETEAQVAEKLREYVYMLCEGGGRHFKNPEGLKAAEGRISTVFENLGYSVSLEAAPAPDGISGVSFHNIVAEKRGRGDEIVIFGAHYDTPAGVPGCGADDNASGVAGILELARLMSTTEHERTIRFVAFVNEEPPFFRTANMGSAVYAKACRGRGEKIEGMVCLEMIGYYDNEPDSQKYPYPLEGFLTHFYPENGNFIAFVGNFSSKSLLKGMLRGFRENSTFPSEGVLLPQWVPGADWSDHRSFWNEGYDAIMVTDTALYRNHRYHTGLDSPDSLDYDKMSRVVVGLWKAGSHLAGEVRKPASGEIPGF
jgi:hypothetical protein